MSGITSSEVRLFLTDYLERKLAADGRAGFGELQEDCDLLLSGMIDSIGLLELVSALQNFAGREIDFEVLEPEQMTIVGPLCKFVAEQTRSIA